MSAWQWVLDYDFDIEPMLLAAVSVPIVLKLLNLPKAAAAAAASLSPRSQEQRKRQKKEQPDTPTPPTLWAKLAGFLSFPARLFKNPDNASDTGKKKEKKEAPAASPDAPTISDSLLEKGSPLLVFKRVVQMLAILGCTIAVGVLAVWKGPAAAGVCIAGLWIGVQQPGARRRWILYDLTAATMVCVLLSLVTLVPYDRGDVLVSSNPSVAAFRSITAAAAAVKDGGVVRILPGTYEEQVWISKAVTLQGLGKRPSDVMLVHTGPGPVLAVTNDVRVRGLFVNKPIGGTEDTPSEEETSAEKTGEVPVREEEEEEEVEEEDNEEGECSFNASSSSPSRIPSPAILVGNGVLGGVFEEVVVGCGGPQGLRAACLHFLGPHPFMEQRLRKMTLIDPVTSLSVVLDEDIMRGQDVSLFPDGTRVEGFEASTRTLSQDIGRHTSPHVMSIILLLQWVDASAHWLVVAASVVREYWVTYGIPLAHEGWTHIKAVSYLTYRIAASFSCGMLRFDDVCPQDIHASARQCGDVVYTFVGWLLVLAVECLRHFLYAVYQVLAPVAGQAGGLLLHLPPLLFSALQLLFTLTFAYLGESQYLQLIIHAIGFVVTAFLLWSGNPIAELKGGVFQASVSIARNIPMLTGIGTEYLAALFVLVSIWVVGPILLPFISGYVSMIAAHVFLPLQGAYSVLKRANNGKSYRTTTWWMVILALRTVALLQPLAVVIVLVLFYFLFRKKGSDPKEETPSKGEPGGEVKQPNPEKTPTGQ